MRACNHTTLEEQERWVDCVFKASLGNIITYSITPKRKHKQQQKKKNPTVTRKDLRSPPPQLPTPPPRCLCNSKVLTIQAVAWQLLVTG